MIKWRSILRIIGLLSIFLSSFMLLPAIVAMIYRDGGGVIFLQSFSLSIILGLILWIPNRKVFDELSIREGFLIVVLFWIVLGTIGAFPFLFDEHLNLDVTTSLFESISGLTTTGATSISYPELLPKGLIFYRQLQQWLGGMGIIVLAVAILPLLGVGGMQLYSAEIPGPQKNQKMQPRITQIAKSLWLIYMLFTAICCFALWLAGMSFFDALCHSFSTLSIGGFSTHANGLAYYNSAEINYIVAFFLVLSGCNYSLHFMSFHAKSVMHYLKDQEFRVFIYLLVILIAICLVTLFYKQYQTHHSELRVDEIVTQVISTATTGGFFITSTKLWPDELTFLLLGATFIGCCAGSTGGGMKVVRGIVLLSQGGRELKRLIHPQAIYRLKLNNNVIPERIIESVWGFFTAYIFIFIVSLFAVMLSGLSVSESFYIVASSINNLGMSIGEAGTLSSDIDTYVKWVMMLDMLLGRLEIFTLLIIFTPIFWRT